MRDLLLELGRGFRVAGIGSAFYQIDDPKVTIDATLHSNADIDFYIIRAATLTLADRIFVGGFASVQVYGNDSMINREVFRLNPGSTQGAQWGRPSVCCVRRSRWR
jgi:hypothetical protein